MVWTMALREIQSRYAGTLAGFTWNIVQPLMMVLIYWFVFSVGLKVQPVENFPFVVVFVCSLIPWTFFAETVIASTNVIVQSPHLVKKVVFPTQILPVVHLVASLVTHCTLLVLLVVLLVCNGVSLSLYNLQFLYYLLALAVFTLGAGWLLSALNVFCRDVSHVVGVVLNMWFWLTPIVWPVGMLTEQQHWYIKLNPLYYIVDGYKLSFLTHEPCWLKWKLGLYFWLVAAGALVLGGCVFKRLKHEFADVL